MSRANRSRGREHSGSPRVLLGRDGKAPAVINEVDEALRNLVKADVVNGSDIEVLFDAPTREWASRRNTPAVDLYLYDIREDIKLRQTGLRDRRDEQGKVVERRRPPRFFKLAYLITAWTQRPEDEHRLLSAILATFIRYDVLPESSLPQALSDLGAPVSVLIAYPPPEDRQVSDVWTSLGGDLKPSLDLVITVIIEDDMLHDIAQAVMAPLRLKAIGHTTYDVDDGVRHLPDRPLPEPPLADPPVADSPVNGAPASDPTTTPVSRAKPSRKPGQKGS